MEGRRNGKVLAIVALLVAVAGLSLGYAALSTTLTINGAATVQSSKWDVHFENLVGPTASNISSPAVTSTPTFTVPTLTGTLIETWTATLKAPGDQVQFSFDIVNDGSYNAKIGTFTKGTPTCSGSDDICSKISYTMVYSGTSTPVAKNDTLTAGQTKSVTVTLTLATSTGPNDLPTGNISVTGLTASMIYVQV